MRSNDEKRPSPKTGKHAPETPADQGREPMGHAGKFSVDVDIGGTFTDAILSRNGFVELIKVDTTPHDLRLCFRTALEKAMEKLGFQSLRHLLSHVRVIRLSTSLSTNMLLERRGVRIGLILEKERRDAFLRQKVFPWGAAPPVETGMVLEVGSRKPNAPWVPPSAGEIRKAAYRLIRAGADVLAISFNDSKSFMQEEQRAKAFIDQFYANHFIGSIPVVTGAQLSSSADYESRTARIVFNTYAHGAVADQFLEIEDYLRDNGYAPPLLLVHSDRGSSRASKTTAEQTISSGASAGIFGAQRFSAMYGLKNVVTVDIGGTSTEIGVIKEGRTALAYAGRSDRTFAVGGLPVAVTVGIGGGSVIRVDENGRIELGPRSVGAFPGPVCYGLGGGEATLTDALLLLGYFDESYYLGGERQLNRAFAQAAFEDRIAPRLGLSCTEAALAVKQQAVSGIALEVRRVLSRFGLPPLETVLFAVGGCGGCLGCDLCDASGLGELYVFRQGSVFGAYGSSGMDVEHRYEQNLNIPLSVSVTDVPEKINASVLTLQRKAFQDMAAEGFQPDGVHFCLQAVIESGSSGVRKVYDCPSPFLWPGEWKPFRKGIMRLFETDDSSAGAKHLNITGIFLTATARVPHADTDAPACPAAPIPTGDAKRSIYSGDGRWIDFRMYDRDSVRKPLKVSEACILESHDTTVIITPGSKMVLDKHGNARIHRPVIRGRTVEPSAAPLSRP